MADSVSRRDWMASLGLATVASAASARNMPGAQAVGSVAPIRIGGQPVAISVASVSPRTIRITVQPIEASGGVARTGELVDHDLGAVTATRVAAAGKDQVKAGAFAFRWNAPSSTLYIEDAKARPLQAFRFDPAEPSLSFAMGKGPLLGLGEGGPQFDRRGAVDPMIIGQGGYRLATHGTRAPIQWLVSTDGWAMFIHQPYGAFDFTGPLAKFTAKKNQGLPFDIFFIASREPADLLLEYARLTGFPEMPPRWAFGYQQSHRTLGGPEEILGVAKTMREKKLPCDALIYLGTEFAPSGWNTRNGEFTWKPENFPDPRGMVDKLHAGHFKVVLHIVVEGRHLTGSVNDACTAPPLPSGRTADEKWPPDRQVACYWPFHEPLMKDGVDGWWPDQGDGFDGPSELNRHRMYWEGPQLSRPDERPYSLHRNASAGVQRYGGMIWSGDVQSRWETLKTHVAVAINTGLSGLPYWGTDIGGFIPTTEYTGELHIRWFQFGAFCPVFRAHGRNWRLRLPWGWNGGDGGPEETRNFKMDPAELKNAEVEPICRKYLELRYRLMPYLYTAVREAHDTGLPIMRSMWIHHPEDAVAGGRADQYFWGRDMIAAPVVEKGATSRRLYLPRGSWFDFWKEERIEGGRELERAVDLATMPLYVRAGAIVPMGPVKQHVDEATDEPMTLVVHPGADGESRWYDDDGKSFRYRRGEWTRVIMKWRDRSRRLSLELAPDSKPLSTAAGRLRVRIAGSIAALGSETVAGVPESGQARSLL
jgi:alpha-glucosidase (family GH31 glycosyl hydrolase)